jgi:hypothetical protein
MSKYKDATDEWIRPIKNGWKLSCCDCHLVHTIDFRIVNGSIELRIMRDNRATGAKRKGVKKRMVIDE